MVNFAARKEVACLLLEFGAQPGIKNGSNESAIDIINSHPGQKADDFLKLLRGVCVCVCVC